MNRITVYWKSDPFKDTAEHLEFDAGLSLLQIRDALEANEHTRFRVDDVLIETLDYVPTPGSIVIAVQFPDDPFTIASAFAYVAGYYGATGYALYAAYAIGFGVGVAGSIALAKSLAPKMSKLDGTGDSSRALLYQGATNELIPWKPVPIILGTYRYVPPFAARPYTDVAGLTQRIHAAYIVGMGDYDVSDFRVGQTPIANFDFFRTQVKKITTGDKKLSLYPTAASPQAVNRTLKDGYDPAGFTGFTDEHLVRTNSTEVSRLRATFLVPNGLKRIVNRTHGPGSYGHGFYLKVEYRRVGLANWVPIYGNANSGELVNGNDTNARFIVVEADVPVEAQYDVRARISCAFADNSSIYPVSRGGSFNDQQLITDCQWLDLTAFESGAAISQENVTVVAIHAGIDEQSNGQIGDFSFLATSKVPIINSDGTIGASSATSNPARLCRWLLTGECNARPVPTSKIDGEAFYAWQEFCEDNSLEFNGVIDLEMNRFQAFNVVARAGRGVLNMRDDKFSVFVDGLDLSTISQLFSHRNILPDSLTISREFPEPIHGKICRFPNKENNYQPDEVVIYNDGYSASNATHLEGYDAFQGIVSYDEMYQHVRYELLSARLRPEVYTFDVPLDGIICRRGDVVRLTYPDILIGTASARVVATSGTNPITAIDLDEPFEMTEGTDYEVAIRSSSNEHTTASVLNIAPSGETILVSSLSFATPLAAGTVAEGDLITFGPEGATYVDLLLVSVEPKPDFTATLVGTNAAPEIFTTLDGEEVPEFESVVVRTEGTDRYAPATPEIVSVTKRILDFGNGVEDFPRIGVEVAMRPGQDLTAALTSRYRCQWRPNLATTSGINSWQQLPDVPVSAGIASFEYEADQSQTFDFRAWAVSPKGVQSDDYALVQDSKIIGDADAPTDLEFTKSFNFLETGAQPVLRLDWQAPADPDTAARFLVRFSVDGRTLAQVYTFQNHYEIEGAINGVYSVEIYTENVAKQLSTPLTGSYTFQASSPLEPLKVKGLEVDDGANGTEFTGPHIKLTWWDLSLNLEADTLSGGEFGDAADSGGRDPFIRDYRVQVSDPSTGDILRTDYTSSTEYIYSLDKNYLDDGPRRTVRFEVRARDVNNQLSGAATVTATNPAPAVPSSISTGSTVGAMFVAFTVPLDLDFVGTLVWAHTSSDVPLDDDHLVCDGPLSPLSFNVDDSQSRWIRIAAYDEFAAGADFNPSTLNVSPAIEIPAGTLPANSVDEEALQANAVTALTLASGIFNADTFERYINPDNPPQLVGVYGTQIIGQALVEEGHFKQIQAGYVGADAAFIKNLTVNTIKITNNAASEIWEETGSDFELFDGTDMDTWTTIIDVEDVEIHGQDPGSSPVDIRFGFGAFVSSLNFTPGFPVGVGAMPTFQYRLVRDLGLGGETVVFTSDRQTISSVGYGLGGGSAPLDTVASGTYTYTLQGIWSFTNYNEGTARFNGGGMGQTIDGSATAWRDHLDTYMQIQLPSISTTWFSVLTVPSDTQLTLEAAHGQGTTAFVAYNTRIDSTEGPRVSLEVFSPTIQVLEHRR